MNILSMEKIVKSYTERKLLDEVSFFLQEGEKVGLIGVNGCGKTTLLKMLAKLEEPESGKITLANHVVYRYLPQHPQFEAGKSVLESTLLFANHEQVSAHDAEIMLKRLGITDMEQEISTLSGGQKKRVALAAVLLVPSEILILDEPTNHLDSFMIDWLEDYLKQWKGSFIMVTHDRYFLDSVTNRIVEIDRGKLYSYETNYSGYLELKEQREEELLAGDRKRKSLLRTELAWVKRGARARSTKQKARLERFEQLSSIEDYKEADKLAIQSVASRLGKSTMELDGVGMSYGERRLFHDFTYVFEKNDRVAFHGKNGCGKTTMMRILAGEEVPTEGNISTGITVKKGYYSQEIGEKEMNPKQRVIDYIKDTAEFIKTPDGMVSASKMLETFLFPGDMQYSPIEKLSGGEKKRLNLLRVLMEAPNILILDEPTNDLDIATLNVLESFLDTFDGIVIIVSHDRYFLDRTVRRIFAFEKDGTLGKYEGGYTDFTEKCPWYQEEMGALEKKNDKAEKDISRKDSKETWKHQEKLKFTFKEQKEYETIEGEISALEERLEELERELLLNARDFVKLNEITKEKEEKEQLLEEKMDRWMYLEDLAAKIAEQGK